jgi:2-phospho-L-lactate guanylyltransferase
MRVLVPYDASRPKTRLADALDADERAAFAAAMLRDVLGAVRAAGHEPTVLATAPLDDAPDVPVTVDDRALTPAVNDALAAADGPRAVVMADLALATPRAVRRLCGADGEVVIAPGRGGGTNALVAAHPDFRVDYHGASYLDHLRAARGVGATVREVDSFRLGTDIDDPSDLADLLIHGDGAARDWLRDAGFRLATGDGRVAVRRE